MKSFFLSVFLYAMLKTTDSNSKTFDCESALERGDNTSCTTPNRVIRFYHDVQTDICFPFLYKGCGGNKNNYDTMKDCYTACPPGIMFHCLGKMPPTGTCGRDMKGCPEGSVCLLASKGPGICCHMEDEKLWLQDFKCKCPKKWRREEWNNIEHLLGKTCDHEFCPNGYECKQGNHLAHCCRLVNKGQLQKRKRKDREQQQKLLIMLEINFCVSVEYHKVMQSNLHTYNKKARML